MIEILRKSWVALLVLALALVAQIPHAAHVFDRAPYIGQDVVAQSNWYTWLLACAYAIALESATLMFVVHGHREASYGFAVASFAVNLSYYAMHGVGLWSWAAFPAWLLSALLPVAIASYSHILAGADDKIEWPAWSLRLMAKLRSTQPVDIVPVVPVVVPKPKPKAQPQTPPPAVDATTETQLEEQPEVEITQPDPQPVAIAEGFQAQLDEMDIKILDALRNGACTPYAISKVTGITITTLKRTDKATGKVSGRLPKLVAAKLIHNSSGDDGSEYRLEA